MEVSRKPRQTIMAKTRIDFIPGAHKTYPLFEQINADMMRDFKWFHKELREKGYNIRCANIAEKNGNLYWILVNGSGDYELEHYGTLKHERKIRGRV